MSTPLAALVAMAVLGAAGVLPTVALAGWRPPAILLAPLGGAVLAGLGAAGCLALGGGLLDWFTGLSAAGAVAVVALWVGMPAARPWRGGGTGDPGARWAAAAGLAAVAGAAVVGLLPLRAPSVGFDARTIWMLHGVWFAAGHRVALAALRNRAMPFAHATYPPLVGGTVGVSWLVTAERSYRLGVVVVALLNACAVTAAAWVAVEAGLLGRAVSRRRWLPAVAGVVVAAGLVLVAFGVAGPFATDGYADLLWSAAAVGAVGYGLVLPARGRHLGAAALLVAVAGLTKDEGIATAIAVVVLVAVRFGARGHRLAAAAAGVVGVLALGGWPVLVRLLRAAPDQPTLGARQGSDLSRAHATVAAMAPHLHVLVLALGVSAGGAMVLRRARRRSGLGNDGWAWGVLAAGTLAVVAAYATGGGNVEFWLATSVHRTTFFTALAAWWVVGGWTVVAAGAVAPGGAPLDGRHGARRAGPPGPAPPGPGPLDAGCEPVLHHQA